MSQYGEMKQILTWKYYETLCSSMILLILYSVDSCTFKTLKYPFWDSIPVKVNIKC